MHADACRFSGYTRKLFTPQSTIAGGAAELDEWDSRIALAIFWSKSRALVMRRMLGNLARGELFHRYRTVAAIPAEAGLLLKRRTSSVCRYRSGKSREAELGKVQSLRIAAVDAAILEPGEEFSFWRAAGRSHSFVRTGETPSLVSAGAAG